MPAPQKKKLTRAQRERLQFARDALSNHYEEALRADRYALENVVDAMRILGLRTYGGSSRQELERLSEYIERVFYRRRLDVRASDTGSRWSPEGWIHGAMPMGPNDLQLLLRFTSLDNRRVLTAELNCWTNHRRPNHLTVDELHISLGSREGDRLRSRIEVVLHSRTGKLDDLGCSVCFSRSCRSRPLFVEQDVRAAYAKGGLPNVWNLLDRVWIDQLLARPMKIPLSDLSIRVRCRALAGRTVRVITPQGPLVGVLGAFEYGTEAIVAVPLVVDGSPVNVPAKSILEMVPHADAWDYKEM
jgi:hypothetical protein